jgi:hypothetical protein
VASTMVFQALRIAGDDQVELDYVTDDGEVRTFPFAVEAVECGIRLIRPPEGWVHSYGRVSSSLEDGGAGRFAAHALTLHRLRLPVDGFLESANRGGGSPEQGPTRVTGERLSWNFSPWDYRVSMSAALAERFRALLLTHTAFGRDFTLEAEGRTLAVERAERVNVGHTSDAVAVIRLDFASARGLATAVRTEPGTVVVPLAPGWSLVLAVEP